jgi:hypothetical protein
MLREVRAALLLAVGAAALVAGAGSSPASTQSSGFFKTPSGKIDCVWTTGGGGQPAGVECGVSTGLKPPIPKSGADCRFLDYVGNRVSLSVTGKVTPIACAGDAGPFGEPGATVYLPWGKVWSVAGLSCSSTRQGLVCANRSGHGFFLSLRSWATF